MGVVWLAEHVMLGRPFALKFLSPKDALVFQGSFPRFETEAKAMGKLTDDHIVSVTDYGRTKEEWPYIVMEALEGMSLRDVLITAGKPLPIGLAVHLLRQACRGVAKAHTKKIVHRDLAPGNLFLAYSSDGFIVVKVLDFGIAKILSPTEVAGTSTSGHVGTPNYMSPEQIAALKDLDHRTDVWTLAAVLYELLSRCRVPIFGEVKRLHNFPFGIAEELAAVVAKGLARNRELRYQTVAEFSEALAPYDAMPEGRMKWSVLSDFIARNSVELNDGSEPDAPGSEQFEPETRGPASPARAAADGGAEPGAENVPGANMRISDVVAIAADIQREPNAGQSDAQLFPPKSDSIKPGIQLHESSSDTRGVRTQPSLGSDNDHDSSFADALEQYEAPGADIRGSDPLDPGAGQFGGLPRPESEPDTLGSRSVEPPPRTPPGTTESLSAAVTERDASKPSSTPASSVTFRLPLPFWVLLSAVALASLGLASGIGVTAATRTTRAPAVFSRRTVESTAPAPALTLAELSYVADVANVCSVVHGDPSDGLGETSLVVEEPLSCRVPSSEAPGENSTETTHDQRQTVDRHKPGSRAQPRAPEHIEDASVPQTGRVYITVKAPKPCTLVVWRNALVATRCDQESKNGTVSCTVAVDPGKGELKCRDYKRDGLNIQRSQTVVFP